MEQFFQRLKTTPEQIDFNETIETIDQYYDFQPTSFQNGPLSNGVNENNGSCKIFAFAKLHDLSDALTLHCFGDYYRKEVLQHPGETNHQNIRQFLKTGGSAISFEQMPLSLKAVDLFKDKAKDWDMRDHVKALSDDIGSLIISKLPLTPSMTVLDFGAGTGLISSHIVSKVKKITAIDISQAMLDNLSAKPELQTKVDIVCQDILKTPLNEQFDVIVSAMAMHHVEDINALIKTFAAHLNDSGYIALADLDSEDGQFHPRGTEGVYHFGFDRQSLKEAFEQQGFHQLEFVTAHTIDKEGTPYTIFLLTSQM